MDTVRRAEEDAQRGPGQDQWADTKGEPSHEQRPEAHDLGRQERDVAGGFNAPPGAVQTDPRGGPPPGMNRPPQGMPNVNRPPSGPPPNRGPGGPPAPASRSQAVRTWLAHPLLLLLMGSLVTGILVPSFTGRWQRNETAQGMKTQVIGDATTAISIPTTQLSVTQNPVFANGGSAPNTNPTTIASTYAAFLTKSDSVDSEIKAYFPENNIPIHWENLVGLMQNFYLLTYANNMHLKQSHLQNIEHYFQAHHEAGGINWNLLMSGSWGVPGYYRTWLALEQKVIGVKSVVLSGIMDAPAPTF